MWENIENSSVAIWVGESLWAYPFWLCLHAIGLALVVGLFTVQNLRLLGLFKPLAPASMLPLTKVAWMGFVVNALSGLFLFSAQATVFVSSKPFLFKISFIAIGMILAAVIQARIRNEQNTSASTKLIALTSLLMWTGAIVSGRLIAYF